MIPIAIKDKISSVDFPANTCTPMSSFLKSAKDVSICDTSCKFFTWKKISENITKWKVIKIPMYLYTIGGKDALSFNLRGVERYSMVTPIPWRTP